MEYTIRNRDPLDDKLYFSHNNEREGMCSLAYGGVVYALNGSANSDKVFFYKIDITDMSASSIPLELDVLSSQLFVESGITDISQFNIGIVGNAILTQDSMLCIGKIDTALFQGWALIEIDLKDIHDQGIFLVSGKAKLTALSSPLTLDYEIKNILGVYQQRLFLWGKEAILDIDNSLCILDLLTGEVSLATISNSSFCGGQTFITRAPEVFILGGKLRNSYTGLPYDTQNIIYKLDLSTSQLTEKTIPFSSKYIPPSPIFDAPAVRDEKYIYILDKEHSPAKIYKISMDLKEVLGFKEIENNITATIVSFVNGRLFYVDTETGAAWIESLSSSEGNQISQTITFFDHTCQYNGEVVAVERVDKKIDGKKFITVYR